LTFLAVLKIFSTQIALFNLKKMSSCSPPLPLKTDFCQNKLEIPVLNSNFIRGSKHSQEKNFHIFFREIVFPNFFLRNWNPGTVYVTAAEVLKMHPERDNVIIVIWNCNIHDVVDLSFVRI